jgi:hypothetical protein
LRAVERDPRVTRQAYYAMTLHYGPAAARGTPRAAFMWAVSAEGCTLTPPYAPVYRNPLLNLYDTTSPVPFRERTTIQEYSSLNLPNTERAVNETAVLIMHEHLLGTEEYVDQLLLAVRKVSDNLGVVRSEWEKKEAAK